MQAARHVRASEESLNCGEKSDDATERATVLSADADRTATQRAQSITCSPDGVCASRMMPGPYLSMSDGLRSTRSSRPDAYALKRNGALFMRMSQNGRLNRATRPSRGFQASMCSVSIRV